MKITLHTNKGDIAIEMMAAEAPQTVENFTTLVQVALPRAFFE
jgi:cyclophilin family peptidyl-prolyl cis-trans isomerase